MIDIKSFLGPLAPLLPALQKKLNWQSRQLDTEQERNAGIAEISTAAGKAGAEVGFMTLEYQGRKVRLLGVIDAAPTTIAGS